MRPTLAALALCGVLASCGCARILLVLPFPARSHHMFATAIVKALAERGHEVVEYSPFAPKTPIANHTHHPLVTSFSRQLDRWTFDDVMSHARMSQQRLGVKIKRIWEMTHETCAEALMHEHIQKLLRSKDKFDLVMVESTFGQEALLLLGHVLKAPTVAIETFFPHSLTNWVAGNSLSVSSVSDLWAEHTGGRMTFLERALNLISTARTLYLYHNVHLPKQEAIARRAAAAAVVGGVPPLEGLVAGVSLYLTNAHPSAVHHPRPYTPNIVPIGGITIEPDTQRLTPELEEFMDSAPDGVIYFSFGSVVPTHTMPKETFEIFINVFKSLPQKILWKIDMASVKLDLVMPPNVKTLKWAPQLAVLGHRSCRLFVTHGGLFSHQEALRAAVPTVYVPFFADQPYNARVADARGTGRAVAADALDERTLREAFTAVLDDPRYKENAQRMSQIYRDLPLSPKESAVYWVEYVLRHRGAPHLRPVSATMAWYKLILLDVVAVAATAAFIVTILLYKITAFIWAMFRKESICVDSRKKLN